LEMWKVVIFSFPLLFGLFALIENIYRLLLFTKIKKWPKVWGSIQKSVLEVKYLGDENQNPSFCYRPEILYQYEVNGQEYNARYDTADWDSSKSEAKDVVSKYPLGASVEICLNPNMLDKSTLSTSYKPTFSWGCIIFWLTCGVVYIWVAIIS
jgi:hypothetical protein